MAITYTIKFKIIPEQRERFLALLEELLDAMRHESTFREAVLHRDPASDSSFLLYETWESHEDVLNVQLKRPYRQAWHDALPSLLTRDREIEIWQPIRSDHFQHMRHG